LGNYTVYHLHSMLSNGVTNIDSITNFREYVNRAKALGMAALGLSEHGSLFEWLHKKEAIEKAGMKYLHAIEVYLTETTGEKIRDNYHCVLIARNYDGFHELNKLVSKSFNRDDGHFYYAPRMTFDELFATSDNIIVTTACLGGVLHNGTSACKERMLNFLRKNAHRCFLEIQHHNCADQIEYNKMLYAVSQEIGAPLIAGTDTHALNETHMRGRAILQKAKGVHFANEDEWDLTFKSYNELVAAYEKQGSLPMDVVLEAIENTNRLADMVEPFVLDYSAKYPKLYGNSEEVFKQKINEGVVRRGIMNYPNYQEYVDRIHEEFETYKYNKAIDFMLLEEDYKSEMRRRNVRFGYSRGSVSGSVIAYLLGITEVDSVKYDLNFERFMNRERVSLADVDTDWLSEDREIVKNYLYTKRGLYCCDIVTFNTIALKGAVNDVCRGMRNDNLDNLPTDTKEKIDQWVKQRQSANEDDKELPPELEKEYKRHSIHKDVPYNYLDFSNKLNDMAEADEQSAREKYPEIFEYVDLVNGCVVSVGNHPAGCVVSPFPVDEWFGTFTTSTDQYPVSLLNMKEIDSLNFVKLDILGLDNIGLIYKTCDAAGIQFLTPDNTPPDDMDVWNSIKDDTTMIFQWESASATAYLRQLFSDQTIAKIKEKNPDFSYMDLLSIGNGAIRPAGESYRDLLSRGIYRDNGNDALNQFLAPTLGYLVYQEQIIEFLHKFCGFTMGEADIVRRHFSKKTGTETDIPIIKDGGVLNEKTGHYIKGFMQTMKDEYGVEREDAEKIIVNFLQVIQDASDYLFSKNHADPYSWIGYICGYLRYHYPLEFITTALNIFEGKEEKSLAIIDYAKRQGIKILPIRFRHSTAQYNFDKDQGVIYKGISSIKYMNARVADELYALRGNQYSSFMEVLYDIVDCTSADARQIQILINLDFFSEFGDANYLMSCFDMLQMLDGRKQIRKDKLEEMGVPLELILPYTQKETEKMLTGIDMRRFMVDAARRLNPPKRTLKERTKAQFDCLGYIDVVGDEYKGMAFVLDLNTKFSPRAKLYSLKNGTILERKVEKKVFSKEKFSKGDIIRVMGEVPKPKKRRTEDGQFEDIPGEYERWLTKYKLIDNL